MTGGIREFYYGTAARWPLSYIPRAMISYNSIRRLKKPWSFSIPWMMDSSAFTQVLRYGDYRWEPEEYARAIATWQPPVAWTMDYPCEPSVQEAGRYTPAEAQARTNDNTRRLWALGARVQSVVQGWTLGDYLHNLDLLKADGLLTDRLGIGSICRRGSSREITRVVTAIYQSVPPRVKLHGFGIKSGVLNTEARFFLHSADSMSWAIPVFHHWKDGVRHRPISHKAPILQRYVEKHEALLGPVEPLGMSTWEGTGPVSG
jgi:hypothetical protein